MHLSTQQRIAPWLLAMGMLSACAHGGAAHPVTRAEDEALRAVLENPTQRDRPMLEGRLGELDRELSRAEARSGMRQARLTRLTRLAVLNALAGLAGQRVRSFAQAAEDPRTEAVLLTALNESMERARTQRRELLVRIDAELGELIGRSPDDADAERWTAERLRIAIELGRRESVDLASCLLRRFPASRDAALARLVLGEAAAEAGDWGQALVHFSGAVVVPSDGPEGTRGDALHAEETESVAEVARASLPPAYVRSHAAGTLSGGEAARYLASLGLEPDAVLVALDRMISVALEDGRTLEALDLATTAFELAADGPRGCRAHARVLSIRLTRDGARPAAEELTATLDLYIDLRTRERGSELERGCRSALVGPSLAIATSLYQDALGLPESAGLGDRVPPAVRAFDRDRMRRADALLERIAAAFPDLRADETLESSFPRREAAQIDAARRVVDDAILATDPTPPPSPRRHPPRHRSRSHRRPHRR